MKCEINKLEKAMLAQGAFIQTLQSRQAKVDNYKTTIRVCTVSTWCFRLIHDSV
jgi:hypothetical protein